MNSKRSVVVGIVLIFLTTTLLIGPVQAAGQIDSKYLSTDNTYWVSPGYSLVANYAEVSGTFSSWYISSNNFEVHFVGTVLFLMGGGWVIVDAAGAKMTSVSTSNQQGVSITQKGGVGDQNVAFFGVGAAQESVSIVWHITTTASSVTCEEWAAALGSSAPTYKSVALALYNLGGGGGGCPNLLVWNGTGFVDEGVLNIHNLVNSESDVVVEHVLATIPALTDHNRYTLKLAEIGAGYNYSHSWIDQVKLYVVDGEGGRHLCPLVFANSSRYGNVLPLLLRGDDEWAQTFKGDEIVLQFIAPRIDDVAQFIFVIEGHNIKTQ